MLQKVNHIFSDWSTPAVEEAYWCSSDMMLGAGMVIIQPETRKIVCVYERARKYWFLPKVCGQALTWSIAMADFVLRRVGKMSGSPWRRLR